MLPRCSEDGKKANAITSPHFWPCSLLLTSVSCFCLVMELNCFSLRFNSALGSGSTKGPRDSQTLNWAFPFPCLEWFPSSLSAWTYTVSTDSSPLEAKSAYIYWLDSYLQHGFKLLILTACWIMTPRLWQKWLWERWLDTELIFKSRLEWIYIPKCLPSLVICHWKWWGIIFLKWYLWRDLTFWVISLNERVGLYLPPSTRIRRRAGRKASPAT